MLEEKGYSLIQKPFDMNALLKLVRRPYWKEGLLTSALIG